MTAQSIYLGIVLILALVSFYLQRLRPDVTALLVMLSLLIPWQPTTDGLRPILTPSQAFHGFGSPALIMVGGRHGAAVGSGWSGTLHELPVR